MTDGDLVAELYEIVWGLTVCDHCTPPERLPLNGIYFFFEVGEKARIAQREGARIVRVGINTTENRFGERIRLHFGNIQDLGGSRKSSVFRKHVGGALLRREGRGEETLQAWHDESAAADRRTEEAVSQYMRANLTFAWKEVPQEQRRKHLEVRLIALLAQRSRCHPSSEWLGLHAASEVIRRTGLWNVQHTSGEPATADDLRRLRDLA